MVGGNGRRFPFGLIGIVFLSQKAPVFRLFDDWLSIQASHLHIRAAVLPRCGTLLVKGGNWKKLERDCSPTNLAEIEREFNSEVAIIVSKMTDDKSLPKAQRKKLQIVNAAKKKSDAACLIKLVDKSSNVAVT